MLYQKKIQSYTPGDLKTGRWSTLDRERKSNPTQSHGCGGLTAPAFNNPLPTVDFAHSPFYISCKIKISARRRRKHKQASKRDRLLSPIKSTSEQPPESTRFLPVRPPPSTPPVGGACRRWWRPGSAPFRSSSCRAAVFHGGWVASKV